ncbi:hypothetical protein CK203_051019 [Vitis vinifera]|uniref:Uncharacterized protein n=1 Tax=Vitis vinifera TaxID=29760 RepID=A0A438GQ10_VITVI|nr:hypothetical protein CK203_051019 [Vitis vinifera]
MGSRCGGTFCTMGAIIGSGRGARVVAAGGLDLPGSCGPSLARIELDNCDFLSRCLLLRNEWNLSFPHGSSRHGCAWLMGLALYVPGIAPVDPGYIDSGSGFELLPGLLSADDEES